MNIRHSTPQAWGKGAATLVLVAVGIVVACGVANLLVTPSTIAELAKIEVGLRSTAAGLPGLQNALALGFGVLRLPNLDGYIRATARLVEAAWTITAAAIREALVTASSGIATAARSAGCRCDCCCSAP